MQCKKILHSLFSMRFVSLVSFILEVSSNMVLAQKGTLSPLHHHHLHHTCKSKFQISFIIVSIFRFGVNSANSFKEASVAEFESLPLNSQPVTNSSQAATSQMVFQVQKIHLLQSYQSSCKKIISCFGIGKLRGNSLT